MLAEKLGVIAAGTVLGYLSGQGVGGGSLLMIWLMSVVNLDFQQAKTLNLLFFIPAAVISSLFHIKTGKLNTKKAFPIILCGVAGAILASAVTPYLETKWIKKAFGVLLIITGIRELHFLPRKAR